jgi:hypothetical protein
VIKRACSVTFSLRASTTKRLAFDHAMVAGGPRAVFDRRGTRAVRESDSTEAASIDSAVWGASLSTTVGEASDRKMQTPHSSESCDGVLSSGESSSAGFGSLELSLEQHGFVRSGSLLEATASQPSEHDASCKACPTVVRADMTANSIKTVALNNRVGSMGEKSGTSIWLSLKVGYPESIRIQKQIHLKCTSIALMREV